MGELMEGLNIQRVEFEDLDGNTQGYAKRGGKVAVSPIAALPRKSSSTRSPILFSTLRATSRTSSSPRNVGNRLCVRAAVVCATFSLVGRLPSSPSPWGAAHRR